MVKRDSYTDPRFYRYLWYIIRLLARVTYRPIPLPENPTYVANEDVTIIVPTIDAGEEFRGEFCSSDSGVNSESREIVRVRDPRCGCWGPGQVKV
jgi:hypothetical protein